MDHNISGQDGLNRDHSEPEDKSREKNSPEVPGSEETEAGISKSGDKGYVRGSLDPQDPSAEKAYQGSLDPQDPSAEKAYQGSLDPQDPSVEKAYQGSLNPQGTPAGARKQGSLNPQNSEQQKVVQGSLDPQAYGSRKAVQGSLASSEVPSSSQQTETAQSTGSDISKKRTAAGGAAPSGTSAGEAAPSGTAAGGAAPSGISSSKAAPSGAGAAGGSDTSASAASGPEKSGVTAAEQEAARETAGEGASGSITARQGRVSDGVPGGTSVAATGGASETAAGGTSEAAAGGTSETAAGGTSETAAGGTSEAATGGTSEAAAGGTSEAAAAGALAAAAAGAAPTSAEAAARTAEAGAEGSSAVSTTGTAVAHVPPAGNVTGEVGKEKKKKKKSHKKALAFWISFLFILLVLGGVYYGGYKYCETHFMPGSTINGFDCSGLTEEEAEKRFADAADKYTLNIRFRGGSTEVLTAQDIGFAYKPDGSIGAMIYGQDRTLWPRYFFEDYSYTMELGGSYDPDLLTGALSALPELQDANMQKPEDAYIQFMDGDETVDGSFQIVPDNPGNTIDLVQLAAGAGDAAARYEQDIDAEQISGAYKEAALKADDADLVARCKDLNDLVGASITYTLPDHTELKLNSDVMKDWLVRDEKGRLVKDDEVWDEKIWEFMELLAYNSNTIGIDREFNSTARGTITVTGGDYGYMVNQIVEHDLLVKDLAEGKVETRKPSYYISAYNDETENDGIGKTYMEVDLTAQHMWCYIDGKMVLETDCVTGDPTTKHETPTGVFGIMFMKKDATLRGIQQKNGKYEYETKVKYWMPFYNDCGFHDAWWRTAFGGEIYKGDGSHGCVNLPSEAAEALFTYCEDKMPVVIYK